MRVETNPFQDQMGYVEPKFNIVYGLVMNE